MNHSFRKSKLKRAIKKEQIGILNRYVREYDNWTSHLENSKKFIIQQLEDTEYSSIAILGSGWLLDVPIEFLSSKFKIIYLVDIIHPEVIRRKFNKYAQIQFIEFDVTQIWQSLNSKSLSFDWQDIAVPQLPFQADIVVSLNLMSQLAELPFDYFLSEKIPKEIKYSIKKSFQKQHFVLLQQFKHWILISDYIERRMTKIGQISNNQLIYYEIPEKYYQTSWMWNFDNSALYIIGINEVKKIVKAFSNRG